MAKINTVANNGLTIVENYNKLLEQFRKTKTIDDVRTLVANVRDFISVYKRVDKNMVNEIYEKLQSKLHDMVAENAFVYDRMNKRVEYKSGRVVYRIVICMGYDNKGKKLVKNLTYSVNQSATPKQQEREAKKYAMDMEDKLKYGYDYNAEKMSFEDFAYKWLESVKAI